MPVKTSNHSRVREASVAGDVVINRNFVEPHYTTEEVKVNWTDAAEQRHEAEAVTSEARIENRSRVQNVTALGDLYVKQPVVLPSETTERV
jgi:hypothetical protein